MEISTNFNTENTLNTITTYTSLGILIFNFFFSFLIFFYFHKSLKLKMAYNQQWKELIINFLKRPYS
ncbi:unnamed protein product [Paramecium sonneborni]|uniref:Uncharacterized protein n=1 Tax=Paramecium sonneborni TaxID=65129 RepID=A0A8S1Q1R1_9CILI|nr:unnamed protein product [Paramecium sonneborni]